VTHDIETFIEDAFSHYMITALWASNDESNDSGGDPMDRNYDPDDIAEESRRRMRAQVEYFVRENWHFLKDIDPQPREGTPGERVGHDLWLTKERHGAGFWDGDYEEPAASFLTRFAEKMGETPLLAGDDGQIHLY
jgi:hypothetical protein